VLSVVGQTRLQDSFSLAQFDIQALVLASATRVSCLMPASAGPNPLIANRITKPNNDFMTVLSAFGIRAI
jgi:hypothetical protein